MSDHAAIEPVIRLGTTIDDQSPETLAVALDECLRAGALDAWISPVLMKKGRLGSDVVILCRPADEMVLVDVLFRHTTTLGVRREQIERHVADRSETTVVVDGHEIRVKTRSRNGVVLGAKPELDDCVRAARALGATVDDVRRRAEAAAAAGTPLDLAT